MSIIFITIPGTEKTEFANMLHERTEGSVDYVIVQKSNKGPLVERFFKLIKTVGWLGLVREVWYAFILRIDKSAQNYLKYFRMRSEKHEASGFVPKVLYVNSINSEEVLELVKKIKPKLIVIWGAAILKPAIFNLAEKSINLHMGLGDHYRGAPANQFAVLEDNRDKIGATVHYLHEKVDGGDVLGVVKGNAELSPREMFVDLNDKAEHLLLDIAVKLWKGESVPVIARKPDGKNILLREWVPSKRYKVAKRLEEWEKGE